MSGSFKDLRVSRKSMELAVEVYQVTKRFPNCELYGLTNQISVPSNIAQGKGHHSEREFKN